MSQNRFPISVPVWSDDCSLFSAVVNQGIDARLEGFCESKFYRKGDRLELDFADSELPVLLRRLCELDEEEASNWASDIIFVRYDAEVPC